MSKWKVKGFKTRYTTSWDVFGPDRLLWKSLPTHAEAMAYADRKARTREVVLPRSDWLTRHGVRLDVDRYHTCVKANSLKYGIYIDIPTQDLRLFALALLAHAEKEQSWKVRY